jgi:2-amino-4-hydroxy-6-hydroxymethyldihydropteridine diphosphokinase
LGAPLTPVWIGLGSNQGDGRAHLQFALDGLAGLAEGPVARSSLYRSAPVGPSDQSDFLNAVVCFDTALSPHALLDQLQGLEQARGRVRTRHWGPRTLDLDILLYGIQMLDDARLKVPHPELIRRLFVLRPMADLDPLLRIPGQGTVADLLAVCPPLRLNPVSWGAADPPRHI